jgi:hypothetical protein
VTTLHYPGIRLSPLQSRWSPADTYLRWHGLLLLGYALAGRGFAHVGIAPLYVGELSLVLGLAAAVVTGSLLRFPRSLTVLALGLLLAWCGARTAVGLREYGAPALRDAVIWSYSLFGIAVASFLISRPARLIELVQRFERFARLFLVLIPGIWLISVTWGDQLPTVPGTEVPIVQVKPGDILVHLAGIAAWLFASPVRTRLVWPVLLSIGFSLAAVRTRAGMLAFALALATVVSIRPMAKRVWIAGSITLLGAVALLGADLDLTVSGRHLNTRQIVANATSIFTEVDTPQLDGPRRWRLEWWSEIVDYTVFGPHFWFGKGFGVNLATDDGFEVDAGRRLRSPHNGHLSFLARAGVPGFLLWALLQLAWLRDCVRHSRESRRLGQRRWAQLFQFLIAYWVAFQINASFDVFLEGPMAGIWFWTVFGVGIAAARIHTRFPLLLEARETDHCATR